MPYRLLVEPEMTRDVYVFTRRDVSLLPAAARFVDILMNVLPSIDFAEGVVLACDGA